uniref:LNS2/PITP domain-containing protein n=1 Tax=Aureoumbra lagunensis TaxID=44058 RepID=A0A7S3NJ46_9STRA
MKEQAGRTTPSPTTEDQVVNTPPDQSIRTHEEASAKRDLSALLPKWYTVSTEHADAVLAALEHREQRLERRQDSADDGGHETASVSSSAIESLNEVEEEDEVTNEITINNSEKKERSWIWSYGSLPRRLLAGSTISQEADDAKTRDEVRALLEELVLRVGQQAEPQTKVGAARYFVRMLWRRGRRDDPKTKDMQSQIEEKEANQDIEASPLLKDEENNESNNKAEEERQEQNIQEIDQVSNQPNLNGLPTIKESQVPLILAGEDGDDEVIDAARFRKEASFLIKDPRLRIRLLPEGRYVELADALPELISRYCFSNKEKNDECTSSSQDYSNAQSPLKLSGNSSSLLELELLLSNRSESLVALREDGSNEDLRAELTSSDNLAALVALDQIHPDLSHTNIAALARSVGMPLDGGHHSSSTLADTDGSPSTSAVTDRTFPNLSVRMQQDASNNDDVVIVDEPMEADNICIEENTVGTNEIRQVINNSDMSATEFTDMNQTMDVAIEKNSERGGVSNTRKGGRTKFPYRKTLRPSQRQLASLGLKRGANSIEFYVRKNTELVVSATVYRWPWRAKCVFADIDGVVAQSGSAPLQLLSRRLGSGAAAHSRSEVAEFFTNVAKHGYRIVYLTTRAIGVASATREALQQRWEGDASLPQAPVLLAPGSLLDSAYYSKDFDATRFKAAALRGVLALFPGRRPLWAALARENDNVSPYLEAGIPRGRVFRICRDDEDKVRGTFDASGAVVSSYKRLNSLIDQTFPPFDDTFDLSGTAMHENTEWQDARFSCVDDNLDDQFNDLNFWKVPLPTLRPLIPSSPVSPQISAGNMRNNSASPSASSHIPRRPRSSSEGGISWVGLQLPKFRSAHKAADDQVTTGNTEQISLTESSFIPSETSDNAASAVVGNGNEEKPNSDNSSFPILVTPPANLTDVDTSAAAVSIQTSFSEGNTANDNDDRLIAPR